MNTRKPVFYKILFRYTSPSFYRANFTNFLHFLSLFILHGVSKHLIEDALCEVVIIFQLLLL